jgi:hypothetical protein
MHPPRRTLLWINLIGGTAVLASYAHGLATHPETRGDVWGGVPEALRGFYTAWMFVAATGYLLFTHFVLFRVDPGAVRVAGRFGYGVLPWIYAGILLPSALWMPLTFAYLEQPSAWLLWAIRVDLAVVGLASLALLASLLRFSPKRPALGHGLAVAGAAGFCVQTAVLDALVWTAFFPH